MFVEHDKERRTARQKPNREPLERKRLCVKPLQSDLDFYHRSPVESRRRPRRAIPLGQRRP
jgi:hypothetical protein